ncbi:MAG: Type secretion system protein [Pseudomonadota bacterium]
MSTPKGFTLIEVLIALTIVTVSALAAYRAASLASNEHLWLKERSLAYWVASNRLVEVSLTPPAVGRYSGTQTQAGLMFHTEVEVSNTAHPRFRRVQASVAAHKDGQPYQLAKLQKYVELK